jgi:hypothetical protein
LDEIGLVVYEEMSFKVKVYGRTPAGRQTKSDHKSSPCHFVTGELKNKWSRLIIPQADKYFIQNVFSVYSTVGQSS